MVTTQLTAQDFFRQAYENRYTWDSSFPGYTADITYNSGDQSVTGRIKIEANLEYHLFDVEDNAAQPAIKEQLWEIAVHRVRRPFEQVHGNHRFSYGSPQPENTVEIEVETGSAIDRYHIKDNHITMVYRHIRDQVITIHVSHFQDTATGYLASHYTAATQAHRSVFKDIYTQLGNYWILSERQIEKEKEGQTSLQLYQFNSIQLL